MRINKDESLAFVIDYQEKLVPVIYDRDTLLHNSKILVKGLQVLEVPIMTTQQYTKGLGMTVDALKNEINNFNYYDKISFSCYGDESIAKEINRQERKNIIICGIEAHICVLQTVIDLIDNKYNVIVVEDCIGSRKEKDKVIALKRLEYEGAILTSYESLLFELTKNAGSQTFKAISNLIK